MKTMIFLTALLLAITTTARADELGEKIEEETYDCTDKGDSCVEKVIKYQNGYEHYLVNGLVRKKITQSAAFSFEE